ncbi:MAG: hypothetical protein HGA77_00185 [Chlorobiaceae bacterium]|nr:hypothetical protein [Chlorobiaceae bacterium]
MAQKNSSAQRARWKAEEADPRLYELAVRKHYDVFIEEPCHYAENHDKRVLKTQKSRG